MILCKISYFHLKSRQQAIYSALLVHFWKAPNSLETDQTEDGHLKLPRDWQEINKLSHYCCLPRVWQEAGVGNRARTRTQAFCYGMLAAQATFHLLCQTPTPSLAQFEGRSLVLLAGTDLGLQVQSSYEASKVPAHSGSYTHYQPFPALVPASSRWCGTEVAEMAGLALEF